MNDLPCIGFGITVVDPGPEHTEVFVRGRDGRPHTPRRRSSRWSSDTLRLLRALVMEGDTTWVTTGGHSIRWKCGTRTGRVWQIDEMTTWTRGHGPQARAALLAARGLR